MESITTLLHNPVSDVLMEVGTPYPDSFESDGEDVSVITWPLRFTTAAEAEPELEVKLCVSALPAEDGEFSWMSISADCDRDEELLDRCMMIDSTYDDGEVCDVCGQTQDEIYFYRMVAKLVDWAISKAQQKEIRSGDCILSSAIDS